MIFSEHAFLKEYAKNLEKKVELLELSNELLQLTINKAEEQLDYFQTIDDLNASLISQKDKEIAKYKRQKNMFVVGGFTVGIGLVTLLILK